MGDTGSMAFGGALAAFAIMMKVEVLLLLLRRDLRDRGALGDDPGLLVQTVRPTRVPHGADPSSLRDEGVVGDEDHGALLDRRGLLCAIGFALYYRYYFPSRGDDKRVDGWGAARGGAARGGRKLPVLGAGALALGVQKRFGDGWAYVVRREGGRARGAARGGARGRRARGGVLVGEPPVMPLPDGAVGAAVGRM